MSGIFNASIFNNAVFNTGQSAPVVVINLGGGGAWRDETEARARRRSVEKFLLKKRNQEEQLEKNIRKLERKATPEAPDAFLARIEENHRKLLEVRQEIVKLEFEFSAANDYIDRIITGWSEDEEDEDDWMLLN